MSARPAASTSSTPIFTSSAAIRVTLLEGEDCATLFCADSTPQRGWQTEAREARSCLRGRCKIASRWWSESRRLLSTEDVVLEQSLQRSHFDQVLAGHHPATGRLGNCGNPIHAAGADGFSQRYSVPSAHTRCITMASFRATAMTARRRPRLLATARPHFRIADCFAERVNKARLA